MSNYARIAGWGKYLPSRVLTNDEIALRLPGADDEWISSRSGIRERRIAGDHETPTSMGYLAAYEALKQASVWPEEVDLIIAATSSPDRLLPSCAALIQRSLKTRPVPAFDLNAACSGSMYALHVAHQFIQTGAYRNILVVGTEVYSRMLNWEDQSTCVLFGDGAGALVVQATEDPCGILSCIVGNDATKADLIQVPGISDPCSNGSAHLTMEGGPVFRNAVKTIVESTRRALGQAELDLDDIDLFVPHQANLRLIDAAAQAAGIPQDKLFVNVERYGNTAAASIPIALCEAVESGRLRAGHRVLLAGVGAGFSWASMVVQWG